jgi:glyoxylase-like metal-dependent hydrolase (beta-lactamase superfamily II)
MLMLRVKTQKSGTIFMVQDLVYSEELYHKHKLPGIVYDEAGYYDAVARIKLMAKEEKAVVWYGHDIRQLNSLRTVPGFYE